MGDSPQLQKIGVTSARSQEQLTVKPSVLSLYSPTMGRLSLSGHRFGHRISHRSSHGDSPQLQKIDLISARSQEQLTVKPSVLSLYSPTGGTLPIWSQVWLQVWSQAWLWGLQFTSHYITSHMISTKVPLTGTNNVFTEFTIFMTVYLSICS